MAFDGEIGAYAGPLTGKETGPYLISEDERPGHKDTADCLGISSGGNFAGPLWYNSLFWPNFPDLVSLNELYEDPEEPEFYRALRRANGDGTCSQQYVTFAAAREDLCQHGRMPQEAVRLRVEVMQYDGVYENQWHFPLQDFIPKRGQHTPYEHQSRRSNENGAITLGLNAEELSDSVIPVSALAAHIALSSEPAAVAATRGVREGHRFVLLSLGGWPFRVRRLGCFEHLGDGGRVEMQFGTGDFREEALWQLLGVNASSEVSSGGKFWCQLFDLDWLGGKLDDQPTLSDPEIPVEKGFIWFRVLGCAEGLGGPMRVEVELLEDGVVPAWMDLRYLQVWLGDIPLGYLNQAIEDVDDGFRLKVLRTMEESSDERGLRKVEIKRKRQTWIFEEPLHCSGNCLVDFGWSIHQCCYRGAYLTLGPQPGTWID